MYITIHITSRNVTDRSILFVVMAVDIIIGESGNEHLPIPVYNEETIQMHVQTIRVSTSCPGGIHTKPQRLYTASIVKYNAIST